MGKGSLVAGAIALAASLVPLTGAVLAIPAGVVSVALAAMTLRRRRQERLALVGLALSGLALLMIFIIWPILHGAG